MLPIPRQSGSDTERWLREGFFRTADDPFPLAFYGMDGSSTIACFDYRQRDPLRYLSTGEAYVHWPQCGSVNLYSFAVHVERTAERQWSQTYCPHLVRCAVPDHWHVLGALGRKAMPDRFTGAEVELVRELFNPQYPTLEQAQEALAAGYMQTVAINRHVILSGSGSVYFLGEIVGTLEQDALYVQDRRVGFHLLKLIGGHYGISVRDISDRRA